MKSKPNFLVIGAQKAGTSWLWVQLRKHPEIWMPPVKELHFFDHLFIPENRDWTSSHIKKGVNERLQWHINNPHGIDYSTIEYLAKLAHKNMFTPEWYAAAFDRPGTSGKVLGDITPEYSTLPENGIEFLKELLPQDLKIIYIIRDPIERALSQLRMNLERRNVNSELLTDNEWFSFCKEPAIKNRGDYANYIPRWEKCFPEENIKYIPYKSLNITPDAALAEIEEFLKIKKFKGYGNLSAKIHVTKKINIHPCVYEYFKNELGEQYLFLKEKFDDKFLINI
jgi:hypothetical protein